MCTLCAVVLYLFAGVPGVICGYTANSTVITIDSDTGQHTVVSEQGFFEVVFHMVSVLAAAWAGVGAGAGECLEGTLQSPCHWQLKRLRSGERPKHMVCASVAECSSGGLAWKFQDRCRRLLATR